MSHPHCSHPRWECIGPAPSFRGERCRLWRCTLCAKEWEVFAGVDLNRKDRGYGEKSERVSLATTKSGRDAVGDGCVRVSPDTRSAGFGGGEQ